MLHVENNIGSEVEVISSNKDKERQPCFRWSAFIIDCISAYKSQMAFMELDFETSKRKMDAELKVIVAEL